MSIGLQIAALIGIPGILSGIVLLWFTKRMKRLDERTDCRRIETILLLKGMLTIGGLASATARAYRDGKPNGYMTDALEDYVDYKEKLNAFLVEQTAKNSK